MEPHDLPRQARLDPHAAFEPAALMAPETLLTDVLARVERLDEYVSKRQGVAELAKALRDPRWEVRAAAIHVLGAAGVAAPLELFAAALSDEHVMVRVAAVRALGRLGNRAPLDHLILALRDPDWEVREAVALTLGELDTAVTRPLLVVALHDSHIAVRTSAEDALARHDAASPVVRPSRRQWASARQRVRTLHALASHYAQVFACQPAIVQRNWLVPALLFFLSESLMLFITMRFVRSTHDTTTTLTIVTTLAAAIGIAFAANMAHDAGAELALATATSSRAILFCRFLVVTSSTALVSGCSSVAIALFYRQGVWDIVQLWLGPMLLASSLTLALVLVIGSWLAMFGACILDALQTLRVGAGGQLQPIAHPALWQTTPLILLLTALCLLFAFLYAPRRLRLPRSNGGW